MPDQLDQMLAIGQSFAMALKLSIPESYVLQWLIVLDTVGSMSLQLFTRTRNQPWEMDFSSLVKKTIIDNLSVPIRYPAIISIDKNLYQAILNCVRAYPQFILKKSLHSRKAMLEEIRKLEIPENFIPIYVKILSKNNQKKCYEITHCSKEFREICPVYKQYQNKKNPAQQCWEVEHLCNELLGIQCSQCIVHKV
jgi:CRISPR/Cas system endoribonuclease Cas6 (RAMP superfamily)